MTVFCILYADVSKGEKPIIISDVLMTQAVRNSADDLRYEKVYIPSIGGRFPDLPDSKSISGLMQKTYLREKYAFVFAGANSSAHEFWLDMLKVKTLYEFLLTCQRYRPTLQFAAIAIDGVFDQVILCASDDCSQLQPGDYGRVLVGGSGESSIRDLLIQQQASYFDGSEDLDPIGRALCLVSAALELDDSSPSKTLSKQFGAYYEITLYEHGTFTKLERVLFSFWEVSIVDDAPRWIPIKMFYHEYVDGILIVRRITIPTFKEENSGIWQDCYGINSFARKNSHALVESHISASAPDPLVEVVSARFYHHNFRFISNKPIIRFEKDGEKWKINPDFNELSKHSAAAADAIGKSRKTNKPL